MTRRRSRKPLDGYPVTEGFQSREAVENYLSDDRIVCLLCGRAFKALSGHLGSMHGITGDEYKDMFNIPYNYGLARETTRKLHSKNAKQRIKENPDHVAHLERMRLDMIEKRKAGKIKNRPRRDFIINEYTDRALKNAGHESQFSDDEKAMFLDELAKDKTLTEALEATGFGKSAFYDNQRNDPAFKEMIDRAIEAQSFFVQAKQTRLGKRFKTECARLLAKGMSDHEIAAKLGVTAMSVNKRTKPMRRKK